MHHGGTTPVQTALMAVIDFDDSNTWPSDLREYIKTSTSELLRWSQREHEIDQVLCGADLTARSSPPENEHANVRTEFVKRIDTLLKSHSFIARHCTRLCRPDFEDLALTGVVPLTPDRTFNRIDALCAAGILTPSVAKTLRESSVSAESGRIGTTWWLLGQSALKDFSGVFRLFGSWGGEAIYWAHKETELGALLRSLGNAAIIEAEIPYRMFHSILPFGEWFLRSIVAGKLPTFEASTTEVVPARLFRIIEHGSSEFEGLTGASTWPTTFQPNP